MTPQRLLSLSLLIAAVIGGGIVAVALGWPRSSQLTPNPDNRRLVALGKRIYAENCASCHGANLEGQPNWRIRKPDGRMPAPPHDSSGHTWEHTDVQLLEITKMGVSAILPNYQSDMPGFGETLSEKEIAGVLAYIKSTWPPHIRTRQPQIRK